MGHRAHRPAWRPVRRPVRPPPGASPAHHDTFASRPTFMPARSLTLDHLVIAARTLDEGVRHVADALGIEPAGGGR
ncbi:VOC family protein, partial [Burkholderia sp. Se-20378]|uniref:VOC family protein n=1 Tax=Burkholderia sp. Se-20378 TaxID=2703899 RepID=UPI0035ABC9FA